MTRILAQLLLVLLTPLAALHATGEGLHQQGRRSIAAAAEMTRWTASVDNDKRVIVELEAEARRANVPPAWLRTP